MRPFTFIDLKGRPLETHEYREAKAWMTRDIPLDTIGMRDLERQTYNFDNFFASDYSSDHCDAFKELYYSGYVSP